MAATAAPKPISTAPANPLEEALTKITGGALSKTTGTSPLSYDGAGFRPAADTVSIIEGPEGTGMTKAEQLSAERAEAAEKLAAQKFAYEQSQNVLQDVYSKAAEARAAEESGRQAEQLGLTKQTTAASLAASALALESERQRQAQAAQGMELAKTQEKRTAAQSALDYQVKQWQFQQSQQAAADAYAKAHPPAPIMQYFTPSYLGGPTQYAAAKASQNNPNWRPSVMVPVGKGSGIGMGTWQDPRTGNWYWTKG